MRESTSKYSKEIMTLIGELSSIYNGISILVSVYAKLDGESDIISSVRKQAEDGIYMESDRFHTKYVNIVNKMRKMYDDIFQYSEDCAMHPTPSTINVDIDCYSEFSTDLVAFYSVCKELSETVESFSDTLDTFAKTTNKKENA